MPSLFPGGGKIYLSPHSQILERSMAARTFLITGSSSGFGLQLVLVALNAGHKVLAAVRDTIRASIEHPMVEQLGGRWVKIDVNDKDTESVVQKLVRENKVDLLVNNAGYAILGALEAMRYCFHFTSLTSLTSTKTFRTVWMNSRLKSKRIRLAACAVLKVHCLFSESKGEGRS